MIARRTHERERGHWAFAIRVGTKEGEARVKFSEPMGGERALDPAALAIDAYGRVWTLDRQSGELLWLWGRKQGE